MEQRTPADDRDSATAPKFYLPAVVTPSFDAGRFERVWVKLFDHSVDPPN